MSIRKVSFATGEYYHIFNRGNSKQKIFNNKNDYNRFVGLMYACNQKENFKIDNLKKGGNLLELEKSTKLVDIGAYCLMPNHFHILLTQQENDNISKFLQKLTTAYVMYYNKKYSRTGGLFEGKFKSEHINSDRYLKYIFSYIHLNPIKLINKDWKETGIKEKSKTIEYLNQYIYSSYIDYMGTEREEKKVLNKQAFPKYFPSTKLFLNEIFEWLNYKQK
ncbi:MAG: transposase [Patescibacteria group bacterium]